jgi:hypothetical protein
MTDQNQDPKPFTFESEAQFTETVNKIIGGHVTKRFESFESRISTKLDEAFSKLTPAKAEEKDSEEKLTLKKLQEQFNNSQKELQNERAANRDKTLRAALAEHLAKSGLPSGAQKLAISHLISEKKAFINDSGEPVFVGEYQGETVSLSEGLGNWVKTEAKDLVPQKQGPAIRPIKTGPTQTSIVGPSEQEQDANIVRLLQERRNLGL